MSEGDERKPVMLTERECRYLTEAVKNYEAALDRMTEGTMMAGTRSWSHPGRDGVQSILTRLDRRLRFLGDTGGE